MLCINSSWRSRKKGAKYSFQDNTEWWQEEVPCPLDSSCYPQISKKESSFITLFEYGDDQALITLTALDHATIQELPNLFAPAFSAFTPFSLVAGGSYLWRNPDKNLVFVLDLLEELQGWTMYCHGLVLKVLIEYNQFCLVLLAPSWVIEAFSGRCARFTVPFKMDSEKSFCSNGWRYCPRSPVTNGVSFA